MRRWFAALICVLSSLSAGAVPTWAQDPAASSAPDGSARGTISGLVRDTTGGVLPGAAVVVTNRGTRGRTEVFSDRGGAYVLQVPSDGTYDVTVSLEGFASLRATVDVRPGEAVVRDLVLEPGGFNENVTVTAQKREGQVLEVPMAITAVTGAAIERAEATTLKDIAAGVPGLSTSEGAPGQARVQIRGISSTLNLPTIGLYLDELPINVDSVQLGADIRLLDMERVEVLRGPQGTLYGEGSMGGTVRYLTKNPNLGAASLSVDGAWFNVADGTPTARGHVVANLPVVKNKFGIRALAAYEQTTGWIDEPATGRTDVNGGEANTFRVKALWVPTPNFSGSMLYSYQKSEFDGQNFGDTDRTSPYVLPQPNRDSGHFANLVLQYAFRSFNLLSSTGYFKRSTFTQFDLTGYFSPYWPAFGLPPGLVQSVAWPGTGDYDSFSQEVRASSATADGRLKWTGGFYYRDYRSQGESATVTTPNLFPFALVAIQNEGTSQQYAVFGEAAYSVSPRVEATVGLRRFGDERTLTATSASFGVAGVEPDHARTFTSTNPRAVVSVRPSAGTLVYASAAKGFRSGGFNYVASRPPGCDLPDAFEPEHLWTYEVGGSAALADQRITLQTAVYANRWTSIQTAEFCPGGVLTQTANVGKASGTGIDVQLAVSPHKSLRLSVAGNYNDSQYDDTSASHQTGDRIDLVPSYTFGAAGDWDFAWAPGWPGRLHVGYQLLDKTSYALRNFPGPPFAESDTVRLLDARLSLRRGAVELSLIGQNLTDSSVALFPAVGTLITPIINQPRSVGVGIKFDF